MQWPPPQVVGREGERARFDCIASGRPLPVVIWFFQSAPVPSNSGVVDLGNGSILIPSLQPRHAGTYLCMLRDPPLDIHSFSLTVEPSRRAPSVTLLPSPSSSVERLPQNSSHPSSAFTIGEQQITISAPKVYIITFGVRCVLIFHGPDPVTVVNTSTIVIVFPQEIYCCLLQFLTLLPQGHSVRWSPLLWWACVG